jgi:hypothetical protein
MTLGFSGAISQTGMVVGIDAGNSAGGAGSAASQ